MKIDKKIIFILAIIGIFALTACSSDDSGDDQSDGNDQVETAIVDDTSQDTSVDISVSTEDESDRRVYTLDEIAAFDGKNGNECYVAVDNIVYQVSSDSPDWVNGVHRQSGGRAECGNDLTDVIDLSSHGKAILDDDSVTEVGDLFN